MILQNRCTDYAPYFGLDSKNLRFWFESQFSEGECWENFAKKWQFDHIIPVTYFDFSNEEELRLCWNFTNLRVEHFQKNKDRGNRLDILMAKNYFSNLYEKTGYEICQKLLLKIDKIEISEFISTDVQLRFINEHIDYINAISNYNSFEFELLNNGRTVEEVNKEVDFIKNLRNSQD